MNGTVSSKHAILRFHLSDFKRFERNPEPAPVRLGFAIADPLLEHLRVRSKERDQFRSPNLTNQLCVTRLVESIVQRKGIATGQRIVAELHNRQNLFLVETHAVLLPILLLSSS